MAGRRRIRYQRQHGTGHDAGGRREQVRRPPGSGANRVADRQWQRLHARQTRDFATALNLIACFTPVQSPESNGISESFVKTFKRDYVRINPLPDAVTALGKIAGWFEDYNENYPHSGLKMRSPREFIRAQTQ